MKKKRYGFIVLIVVTAFLLFLFSTKQNYQMYIGCTGIFPGNGIDVVLRINEKIVFEDTINYHSFNYSEVNVRLRPGFNRVEVISNGAQIKKEYKIFLLLFQHIIIEFYPPTEFIREHPEITIRTSFNPFYYQ